MNQNKDSRLFFLYKNRFLTGRRERERVVGWLGWWWGVQPTKPASGWKLLLWFWKNNNSLAIPQTTTTVSAKGKTNVYTRVYTRTAFNLSRRSKSKAHPFRYCEVFWLHALPFSGNPSYLISYQHILKLFQILSNPRGKL